MVVRVRKSIDTQSENIIRHYMNDHLYRVTHLRANGESIAVAHILYLRTPQNTTGIDTIKVHHLHLWRCCASVCVFFSNKKMLALCQKCKYVYARGVPEQLKELD